MLILLDFARRGSTRVRGYGGLPRAQRRLLYGASQFNYASYVVAGLLFVLITIPLARFTDRLIARDKRRQAGTAA